MSTMQRGKRYVCPLPSLRCLTQYSAVRSASSCHSRSNISTPEICRRRAKRHSSVLTSTALNTSTKKEFSCLSISTLHGSSTRSTSSCRLTKLVSSPSRSSTALWELRIGWPMQISRWRTYCLPSSRIAHHSRYSTAWQSSTLTCYCSRSIRSKLYSRSSYTILTFSSDSTLDHCLRLHYDHAMISFYFHLCNCFIVLLVCFAMLVVAACSSASQPVPGLSSHSPTWTEYDIASHVCNTKHLLYIAPSLERETECRRTVSYRSSSLPTVPKFLVAFYIAVPTSFGTSLVLPQAIGTMMHLAGADPE